MAFPKSRILSASQLVQHITESNRNGERFCFILGSGASVESGIPSGNTLEMRWMNCVMGVEPDWDTRPMNTDDVRRSADGLYEEGQLGQSFDQIEAAWRLVREGKKKSIPSEYYFDIYKLRFFPNHRNGYRYLERIMESREPSLGYRTLARLMTDGNQNNLVITTNFDSLVEDALLLYSAKKPLVVGHEALAGFIESDIQRPIIAKVHRDLMYAPFNSPETTGTLKKEWRDTLNSAFITYTPIVVGYAGGDRSLMSYLEEKTTSMRHGVYWCFRKESGLPEQRIQDFVNSKGGYFVEIEGFDDLMMKIGVSRYPDDISPSGTDAHLERQYKRRSAAYTEQWEKLNQQDALKQTLKSVNEQELRKQEQRTEENALTARDHYQRGKRASDEKDYQRAIDEFSKAIEKDPEYTYAYIYRGNAYYDLGQYERAIQDYDKAIQLDPNYAKAYYNRGLAYYNLGQYKRAIEDYDKAIQLDPNYAKAYNNRGNAYYDLGQYERAIQDYDKAIQLDPNYAYAYNNRGTAYDNLQQYEKAIADYTKVIQLNPKFKLAYENRALTYRKIGKKDLAKADEEMAAKLE